jgi:hypothetical protein
MRAMASAERLLADLRAIFGSRLISLVVYGRHAGGAAPRDVPVHTLALVEGLSFPDLDACGRVARGWQSAGFAVPLIINRTEFARSLDVFPVEFGAIIDAHAVVFGPDPFADLSVSSADLRRACEVGIKGHLLHLREAYVERHGELDGVARLVETSAGALRTLVGNVARLDGRPIGSPLELAPYLTGIAGPSHGRALMAVLSLGDTPMGADDAARLFPEYLAATEALAAYVDAWH